MTFEIGEVLSRSVQITWRKKSFWGLVILPMLMSFAAFPIYFIPLLIDTNSPDSPIFFDNPVFLVFFFLFHVIFILLTVALSVYGYSALTLGIVRVDRGEEGIAFKQLLQDARNYFPRMLGVMLITTFGIGMVFFAIFACLALFGMVTAGVGFICIQPFIIVLYPVMMMVYAFMEQAQAAVVVDELGVREALTKGWELLKANFWRLALISLVIYLGISFVSSLAVMPFMIPLFFFPFFLDSNSFDPTFFGLAMGAYMLVLFPLTALVQGVAITFMKSAYVLVYLRLTRPSNQPVPAEATV
ncbi:MAG: hypothetical protein AB1607_13350 [Chloroflexota bacterium]